MSESSDGTPSRGKKPQRKTPEVAASGGRSEPGIPIFSAPLINGGAVIIVFAHEAYQALAALNPGYVVCQAEPGAMDWHHVVQVRRKIVLFAAEPEHIPWCHAAADILCIGAESCKVVPPPAVYELALGGFKTWSEFVHWAGSVAHEVKPEWAETGIVAQPLPMLEALLKDDLEPPAHVTEPIPDNVVALRLASPERAFDGSQPSEPPSPSGSRPPDPINLDDLEGEAPPPRFLLKDWIPAQAITLLSAHGSGGKSMIALYMSVCMAAGLPFGGSAPERRFRTMFYSCEDGRDILHFRLRGICMHLGIDVADLKGALFLEDATESDNILYRRNGNGIEKTIAHDRLKNRVQDLGIDFLVLDNASDMFDGDEINRAQVRAFMGDLKSLIQGNPDAAVLLLGHVNKQSAINSKLAEGYSGSTAWHNSARAVLYVKPDREDETGPVKERVMTSNKQNYAKDGASVTFLWDEMCKTLVPKRQETGIEKIVNQRDDDRGLLLAVHDCQRIFGEPLRDATSGSKTINSMVRQSKALPKRFKSMGNVQIRMVLMGLVDGGMLENYSAEVERKEKRFFKVTEKGLDFAQNGLPEVAQND